MSTLEQTIGNTPLVKLQRMGPNNGSEVWLKLEGNNPAGSVKDRAALSMIVEAEKRGEIKPGDVLIEATSGNTGIALAMIAALKGYRMKLLMPDNMSQERRAAMRAYGAELILVTKEQGMEGARDLALEMANRGEGKLLDQFNNPDNPYAHYTTTGPEIWQQTGGAHYPFCFQHGDNRHHYRCVTLYARTIQTGDYCWPAARRGQQHSGDSPLASGISAGDFQRLAGG